MVLSFVSSFAAWPLCVAPTFRLGHCEQIYLLLPKQCGESFAESESTVRLQWTSVTSMAEAGIRHLMEEPAASGLAEANDKNADEALALKILALNNTVMNLQVLAELTTQEIICNVILSHHQMAVLSALSLPLQIEQLETLIASMRSMTQQVL